MLIRIVCSCASDIYKPKIEYITMQEYIPKSETEIRFLAGEKPDDFEQIRNIGTIQEYTAVRDKTFWERISIGGSITAKPIVYNNTIYFGACDKNFYALDLEGKEKWRFSTNGTIQSYALTREGRVYFGSGDRNLYCLDSETGGLVWKFQADGHIGGSPVWHNGRVYFGSSDGNLYCIDAQTGEKIWVFRTPYALITPLIKEERIYAGYNGSSLYCLNLKGELLWRFNANSWIAAWPAASENGMIYFGSGDGNLYAITLSGQLKWTYKAKDSILCPVVKEGRIYFGCGDNKMYCVDSEGKKLWDFKTEGTVGHATVGSRLLYFGSYDNHMYAVDRNTGKLAWRFQTNGFVHTNPEIHGNLVIFGSWDCNLYCLDREGNLIWKFPTSISTQSKIEPPEKTETKKIEITIAHESREKEEKKYSAEDVMGNYEANVTEYAGGISKTYIASRKKGYIGN